MHYIKKHIQMYTHIDHCNLLNYLFLKIDISLKYYIVKYTIRLIKSNFK